MINVAPAHLSDESVEALNRSIEQLVDERQRLRAETADEAALEANRRQIAQLQQRLSRALITRYRPATA